MMTNKQVITYSAFNCNFLINNLTMIRAGDLRKLGLVSDENTAEISSQSILFLVLSRDDFEDAVCFLAHRSGLYYNYRNAMRPSWVRRKANSLNKPGPLVFCNRPSL